MKKIYRIIIIIMLLVLIDQLIKYGIVLNSEVLPIDIIKNILKFNYVENYGIAFGLARGGRIIFIVFNTIFVSLILGYVYIHNDKLNNIKKSLLSIIVAGGIGNLIDRIFRGFVVDYIDITRIN